MRIGVHGLNMGLVTTGADTAALARRVEQLGYDSWWTGDHVVIPIPTGPPSPTDAVESILDPIVDLTYVAASTERLELGTGILLLPLRNPVVLAKQVASLDVLSSGRLLLGVGAGWLEPEMRAVGIDPSGRGARIDEYLDAMTSLWTDPAPEFHGKYVDFAGVVSRPLPAQAGGPRIVVGGNSPVALRRAVGRGHGWFGTGPLGDLAGLLDGLAKAAREVERPARLGRLELTYMFPDPAEVTVETTRAVADLGVDRFLLFTQPLGTAAAAGEFLERHADLPR